MDVSGRPDRDDPRREWRERCRELAERRDARRKAERLRNRRLIAESDRILRKAGAGARGRRLEAEAVGILGIRCISKRRRRRAWKLAHVILERAPLVLNRKNEAGLWRLARLPWQRELEDWRPAGHGWRSQMVSLVDHLLVLHPVPAFLMKAFLNYQDDCYYRAHDIFAALAAGKSVRDCIENWSLPATLTRRMRHLFYNAPVRCTLFQAIVRAHVLAFGGSEALASTLSVTELDYCDAPWEFWAPVIHWMCRQPGLDPGRLKQMVAYLDHCHGENREYSISGRTVGSVMRGWEAWDRSRRLEEWAEKRDKRACLRRKSRTPFRPSGLEGGHLEVAVKRGGRTAGSGTWTMVEILTGRGLVIEGRALDHCVAVYIDAAARGECSIWSLRRDGKPSLTLEVDRKQNVVVQACGHHDRDPNEQEAELVRLWAARNGLEIGEFCLDASP